MQVQFVALQSNGKETLEKPLFEEDWALVQVGKRFKSGGKRYLITATRWMNPQHTILKAICKEFQFSTSGQPELLIDNQ